MRTIAVLARRYGLDGLIVLAAVESALEVAFRQADAQPQTTRWFAVPASVIIVLPLLGRRRLPFAVPASLWVFAAAVSFIDGRLVVFSSGIYAAGMAAAFLLGNGREANQARMGLAIVLGGAAIVVYNDPAHAAGELIFVPVLFGIAWLAGFALRERARRLPHAACRRTGHQGGGRGEQRPGGRRQGCPLPSPRRPDGYPHARTRRSPGNAADPGHRPGGAHPRPDDVRSRRIHLRGAALRGQWVRAQGRSSLAAPGRNPRDGPAMRFCLPP